MCTVYYTVHVRSIAVGMQCNAKLCCAVLHPLQIMKQLLADPLNHEADCNHLVACVNILMQNVMFLKDVLVIKTMQQQEDDADVGVVTQQNGDSNDPGDGEMGAALPEATTFKAKLVELLRVALPACCQVGWVGD